MKLYVMRHGFAGDYVKRANNMNFKLDPADLNRSLQPDGEAAVRALAAWLSDNDEIPTRIVHSPVKRAKQTAKILGRALGIRPEEEPNLGIQKPAEMVIKALAADKSNKRMLLIAHADNLPPALRALNYLSGADKFEVDPFATAEMRILDVDRDTFTWSERQRVMPSDLGQTDLY